MKVSYFACFLCLRGGSDPSVSEQALMVSRALERDVQSGYAEIQGRIDVEAARSAELAAGRLALRAKVKKLKAKVEAERGRADGLKAEVESERGRADGLEGQLRALKDEVASLRNDKSVLEAEVATERALSASVSEATWLAMERLEGAVVELGAVPPPREHTVEQMDATLDRLHRAGEVFVPAGLSYANHSARVGWTAALVSLKQAGCAHVDGLGAGSVPVASVAEVASGRKEVRRASNALFRGFWASSGREATMESLRAALALKGKGKDVADGPGAGERGATTGDQV